jgi:xylulokinase
LVPIDKRIDFPIRYSGGSVHYLLGIDVGTTGTKSALYGTDGTLIEKRYQRYPLDYPKQGWAEQDPEDWWNAIVSTVRPMAAAHREAITAMSLSTQGGCLVLLDKDFNPVYRAVSWMDTRASETASSLRERISIGELYRTSGWPVMNGLNLPTICWFREKMPGLLRQASYFSSTIDYLNHKLTGKYCIDSTNLALTGFLDLKTKGLSRRNLVAAEIAEENIAKVVPSGAPIGTLCKEAFEVLGLRADVTVVSGAHDQYCANIGAGAVQEGSCVLDAGTSWVLLAVSGSPYFSDGELHEGQGLWGIVFPGIHPLEGKYGLMTVVPFGGSSLTLFRDTLGGGKSIEDLTEEACGVEPGCEGLSFMPVLSSGSGRGAFIGIDTAHTFGHYARAVLEGVALANRYNFETLKESGLDIKKIAMVGGGAKNRVWPQVVADVLGIPVEIPEQKDPECAGAAILAGLGAGIYSSLAEAVSMFQDSRETIEPDPANMELYERIYRRFLSVGGSL